MAKRILLFLLTNIMVIATISILLSVLNLRPYLTQSGIDYQALFIFCLVIGMTGAVISLLTSRMMAKWGLGVKVIDPTSAGQYLPLVQMVARLSRQANLPAVPEVGIYQAHEANAFATGPTKSRSLVAFSTGMLEQMNESEIEGVAAHEIAHIANGDMVTMTLIQGVINTFAIFFARVLTFFISQAIRKDEEHGFGFLELAIQIVLEIAFTLLGSIVVAWFSRQREFKADRGSASYAGREKMIAALEKLKRLYPSQEADASAMAVMKISSKPGGLFKLFSTHPPLEARIRALQTGM
jgi:heat shock protein HtpX